MCREFVGKLPVPLGEGWGEGLATERKHLSPFLFERTEEAKEENLLLQLLNYALTQLSPKGRGVYLQRLTLYLIECARLCVCGRQVRQNRRTSRLSQHLTKRLIEEFDHGPVIGLFLFAGRSGKTDAGQRQIPFQFDGAIKAFAQL